MKKHPNNTDRAIISVKLAEGLRSCDFRLVFLPKYSTKHHCFHWLCELPNNGHVCLCGFKLYRRAYGNWRISVSRYHTHYHRRGHLFQTNALTKTAFSEFTLSESELHNKELWFLLGRAFAAMLSGTTPTAKGLELSEDNGSFPGGAWTKAAWEHHNSREQDEGRRN